MDTILYNGVIHTMAGRTVSALAIQKGRVALAGEEACHVREVHLGQGREMVRRRAALHAMDLLRRQLTGCPL